MKKGSIQPGIVAGSPEVCPACGSKFTHSLEIAPGEKKMFLRPFCPNHPKIYPTKYRVMFGNICHHHSNYETAEMELLGLRHEHNSGQFDERDYKIKTKPLSFDRLVDEWLHIKQKTLNEKTWRSMAAALRYAQDEWGEANIKSIGYAQIQDFLIGRECKSKTKWNLLCFLKQFWKWVEDRYDIQPLKKWPEIGPVEMEYRKTLPLLVQQQILDDIKRHEPFRVWLGVSWQARYLIRPRELRDINEDCVDRDRGLVILLRPKGRKPEVIKLEPSDLEIVRALPVPEDNATPFFRHEGGIPGAPVGTRFGENQFRRAWLRACERLGVKDVALYAGTKHTTMTALGQHGFSLEAIKMISRHKTSTAALRYAHMPQNYGARDEVLARLSDNQSDNDLTTENGLGEKVKSVILQ